MQPRSTVTGYIDTSSTYLSMKEVRIIARTLASILGSNPGKFVGKSLSRIRGTTKDTVRFGSGVITKVELTATHVIIYAPGMPGGKILGNRFPRGRAAHTNMGPSGSYVFSNDGFSKEVFVVHTAPFKYTKHLKR